MTPKDSYSGRTAPLTSKLCILYIYSTITGTEYFKHGIYSPLLSLQNAVCFIILTYFVPLFFTFYIQVVLKLKKKRLIISSTLGSLVTDLCPIFILTYRESTIARNYMVTSNDRSSSETRLLVD